TLHPLLDDVERIEVVRGPGAALWGANAVNGVINIVTRRAAATGGTLVSTLVDDQGQVEVAARQGFAFGNGGAGRVFAQNINYSHAENRHGASTRDDANGWNVGFRLDHPLEGGASWSVSGGAYHTLSPENVDVYLLGLLPNDYKFDGAHLMGRGTWRMSEGEASLQMYVDHLKAGLADTAGGTLDSFDVDFQHRLDPIGRHELIWGAGLRLHRYEIFSRQPTLGLDPARHNERIVSGFVQDEISLAQAWRLTLGARMEYNTLSGAEFQPNARLMWTPTDKDSLWTAWSRASRVPSIGESYGRVYYGLIPLPATLPAPPVCTLYPCNVAVLQVPPAARLDAERLTALELGYRRQLANGSLEAVVFHHMYDRMLGSKSLGMVPADPSLFPTLANNYLTMGNGLAARSTGLELGLELPLTGWARLHASYTLQNVAADSSLDPITAQVGRRFEQVTPHQVLALRLALDLAPGHDLDIMARHAGASASAGRPIPAHAALDANYRWKVNQHFELAAGVRNLFDNSHLEFNSDYFPSQQAYLPRSAFIKGTWRY
ncbi:MAG: TonB-dependent receptor, partial [Anaerolineae bacterium]|nr:TonB-dependent receptor [Anaerolineae bacterium]